MCSEIFVEIEFLREKCRLNEQKTNIMDAEIEAFVVENQKKKKNVDSFQSILEKMVKNKVKDLKLYMKKEVEATLQDLLTQNPQLEKFFKNQKNEEVYEDLIEKLGFTSKFFTSVRRKK